MHCRTVHGIASYYLEIFKACIYALIDVVHVDNNVVSAGELQILREVSNSC